MIILSYDCSYSLLFKQALRKKLSGVPNLQFGDISDARKPDISAKLQVWHSVCMNLKS
ncbi:Uncharacterized protein dnm_072350 [Desulfonema magnum]|uniref:Uncharacterized protein n=1 Tax=Desulfonema magnum TaxID=45655 RepID=A0A975GRQ5_9BACT|nr:Uncharacterized protein dnm_072350 [Desulfonema magnum]